MTYLLLRDNKQSGPYSLEDLKTKGLKAYDLVWVEGRSAAWRYPSEIDELSAFAPAVEEQPFDRFYKKPAAVSGSSVGSAVTSQPAAAISSGGTLTSQPFYSEDQPSTTRKRTIYVTMPGGTAAPVTVRETVREVARETTHEPLREIPRETVRPAAAALPIDDYAFSAPIAGKVDNSRFDNSPPPVNNGDYAGELMPRSRPRHKANILQPILIGVGILVLLAGGIFIGLSINRDTIQPITHSTAQPLPVTPAVSSVVIAPRTQSVNPTATTQDRDHSIPSSLSGVSGIAGKTGKIAAPKQKAILPKSQAVLPPAATDSSAAGIPVVHREAEHRTDAADNPDAADKGAPKVNLASQVSVGASKYEVGTFGGISNLQVTVSNRSAYPLDLVVVEVQYIQANKKTYKTENLYFHGVGPGMALMQEAPRSSRGIKVEYKITLINSKELGLSESGL
jgi:cytoskeletal protein RodZ